MTDCPNGDIRDVLPDFMHGRLDAAEHALVDAHLRTCELCREELALLRGMHGVLRRAPAVDVSRIAAAIPSYRAPARQLSSRHWGGWRIAAAVTLLAAGGTSVAVARHGEHAGVQSPRIADVRPLDVPSGTRAPTVAVTTTTPLPASASSTTAASAAPRELALGGGTIGDLDDRELSALIDDIGSLDAVPSVEVDNPATLSPIAPTSPSGMNN